MAERPPEPAATGSAAAETAARSAVHRDHLEVESTFDAGADFTLPDLADLAPGGVEARRHRLAATYFDTAGLRLAARGITLRRRLGGDDAGWHLKIPWGRGAKREFTAPPGTHARRVPARLSRLAASASRGAPLRPVARITTRRTEYALRAADGTALALVADDRVTGEALAEPAERREWREVEVELGTGDRRLAERAADRLLRAGAAPSATGSKLLTLLGARVSAPRPRPSGGTAADAVLGYLHDQLEQMVDLGPRVRTGEYDSVHRMRVCTRRLRTALALPGAVDREAVRGTLGDLRAFASVLGEARDLEVLRERFAARLDALPDRLAGTGLRSDWLEGVDRRRRAAERAAVRAVDGPGHAALLAALERLLDDPPPGERAGEPAAEVLGDLVDRARTRLRRDRRRAEEASAGPEERRDAAWHRVRKSAKRLRYAATLAEPYLGARAARLRGWAAELQQALGDHQDGVAAVRFLDAHGRRLAAYSGDRAAAAAALAALSAAEITEGPHRIAAARRIWKRAPGRR
ncbi:CYTH and CHAD domain-containing protein [Nocardiopsis potens]|uniref:CYTH and CHAD domain-containing protein n=1 Tax=Nocardiopsis potens TaxID=1246458 RepID=UPI000347BCA4|nr:CHAD domain-containing protein [Nocardiopsis potens]